MAAGGGPLRVAVVGAGIGGLCTAAALQRDGAQVTVFDRATSLREAGAGLQLAPNATRLLARLGLPRHLGAGRAVGPSATELRRWDDGQLLGRTLLGLPCATLYGAPYLTVLRSDVQEALLSLLGREQVRTGHRLTSVADAGGGVRLEFAGREAVVADLVVGADGLRSTVRRVLQDDDPVPAGQLVHRGLVPAARLPAAALEPRVTIWVGPDRHCVVYPVAGRSALSFAATVAATGTPGEPVWSRAGDVPSLLSAYAGWDPALLAVLSAADDVGLWALHDREPLRAWSTDRVTVVGDAAHPMLPFLAQGAGQAVEDAAVLVELLHGARREDLPERLRAYEAARRGRAEQVVRTSRAGGDLLHARLAAGPDPSATGEPELRDLAWLWGHDAPAAVRTPA